MKKKRCAKCTKVKTLAEFPENKKIAGGISPWCNDCHSGKPTMANKRKEAKA